MRSPFASPRMRRRLAWGGGAALVAVTIVVAGVIYSNSINIREEPLSQRPARLGQPERKEEPLAPRTANAALRVAARFVVTAVRRDHVEDSWALTSPELRAGYTRKTWGRGEIPIVPYPVNTAKWQVDYTYHDSMGLKVALFAKPTAHIRPAVFNIGLKKLGHGNGEHWVVDNWQPLPQQAPGSAPTSALGLPNVDIDSTGKRQLGAAWILVPLSIFSLLILIPLGLGLSQWYRGRQAKREYLRHRSASS